jgi:hypothetical protein
MIRISVKQSP